MKLIIDLPDQKDIHKLKEIEQKLKGADIDGLAVDSNKAAPKAGKMGLEALMPSITATIKAAQEPLIKLVEVLGHIATLWKTELKLSRSTEKGDKEEIGIITSKLSKSEILLIVEKFYDAKNNIQ